MTYQEQGWTRARAELLMDITATLSEYTQHVDDFRRIPGYLCRVLRLDSASLAIMHEVKDGVHVVLAASSSAENSESLEQNLMTLYQQTKPAGAKDVPAIRPTAELEPTDVKEMPATNPAEYPRATVFSHSLEQGYRMLLVVGQKEPHLSPAVTEILQVVAKQLSKLLSCLVVWLSRPEALGAPFDRLTDREWMVLRGMNSECGEKQLADQLGLSPHTLHSHIKSIYRKVGVQGRLPLLLRVQEAMRTLRVNQMNGSWLPPTAESGQPTALAV